MKWRVSSRTSGNGGTCVEVGRIPRSNVIATRDTKDRSGPQLRFSTEEYREFLERIKKGELDL